MRFWIYLHFDGKMCRISGGLGVTCERAESRIILTTGWMGLAINVNVKII